ncbi:MAG TPA: deoxyhypusine synthase, partial [Candidatus Bathyarchaeota archaeon]|nr:deoxyhypusine synthase [Candidatus Bathyarchaeota archaeon]
MLKDVVEDYKLLEDMSVDELVLQMEKAWGFTAGKLALGVKILERMIKDDECVKFLSFPANLVATGMRGIFKELVKRRLVDVVITTCGTLDHDVARCWKNYYQGFFLMDDAKLREEGINRLGNVLVPNESYGIIIEKKMQELLQNLWDEGVKEVSTRQLCREMGKRICNESSILHWAAENGIPVYVPGITDGAVGYQ